MLDSAIIVQKLRSDRADFGADGIAHQLAQPLGLDDLGVIVKEAYVRSLGLTGGAIVDRREVVSLVMTKDAHARMFRNSREIAQRFRFNAAVVDNKDL